MKTVSVDQLKRHLSAFLKETKQGEPILVTRHNKPIARLTSATSVQVHRGRHFGEGRLEPLKPGSSATSGRYLEVLRDDRQPSWLK